MTEYFEIRDENQNGLQPLDCNPLISLQKTGGVDGTRTRDPRRDRPEQEPSNHEGSGHYSYSKDRLISPMFPYGAESLIPTFRTPEGVTND